ncbi:hypothetical protein N9R81_06520 [Flavobacteriales bacterium]|nr:hypothetical protein [Flavobacteriales bacterium]
MDKFDKRIHRSNQLLIAASILLFLVGVAQWAKAQNVGINATGASPDASAILDISSTDKGLLTPRVSLTATSTAAPITSPATSLLVYNTNTAGDVTPGYYYWDGAKWVRLINNTNPSGGDWSLTGNSGTTAGTNFIGTTDAEDLTIYTNNSEKVRIQSGGNVGIGTTNPLSHLHIATGADASLGGAGYFIVGQINNQNIVIDNNEIISRDNAGEATLHLQTDGGPVMVHNNQGAGTRFSIEDNGDVGIGTSTIPKARLQIQGGDTYVSSIGSGNILRSPDSSCWRVTVDNSGNLVTTSITCP